MKLRFAAPLTRLIAFLSLAVGASSWMGQTAEAQAPTSATLSKIKKSGEILIGHREDSVPFSYVDSDKKPAGYSVDLCLRIADEIKTQLAMPALNVKFVKVTPQDRFEKLTSGAIDIECGSTTNTLSRQKLVAFTWTTYVTGTALAGRASFKGKELADLVGKKLAVAKGTTNERVIRKVMLEKSLKIDVKGYESPAEAFAAVERGDADAAGSDDILLYGLVKKSKTPANYVVFGRQLSFEPYGLETRKDDYEFHRSVNAILSKIFSSGQIKSIFDKWFRPLNVPMNEMTEAAYKLQGFNE